MIYLLFRNKNVNQLKCALSFFLYGQYSWYPFTAIAPASTITSMLALFLHWHNMLKLPSSNIYCSSYGTSNQNRQLYIHMHIYIYANGATVTQHCSNIAHNHPNSGISCGTNTNISFPVNSKHSFRKPGLEITHRSKNYTINEYLDVCTWKAIYTLFQR